MISQFQTPPDDGFSHYALLILCWLASTFATGWLGYLWGLRSQKAAEKLKIKMFMLPLIEGFISRAARGELMQLRYDSTNGLFESGIKLKSLLKCQQRKRFIEVWERFNNTTPEEVHHPQLDETKEKYQKMKDTIMSRLESLRKVVQEI